MSKVYLMSAFHIDGYNRANVQKIAKAEPNCHMTVFGNHDNSWMTFAIGYGIEYEIGKACVYIKDTGNGYGHVPHSRANLYVRNVITIKDGVATGVNEIGMSSAHSVKVYK